MRVAPGPDAAGSGSQVTSAARVPGIDAVEALLERAAHLDLGDPAWRTIGAAARRATTRLVAAGRLDPALVVAPDDPPVVVARTLATVWRTLAARVRCGATGSDPWASSTTVAG